VTKEWEYLVHTIKAATISASSIANKACFDALPIPADEKTNALCISKFPDKKVACN
jgi:hypothetical protein